MAKPVKETKASQKPNAGKTDEIKNSAKSKKEKEEDDDDFDDEQDDDVKASPKKAAPKTKGKKKEDDSDDDDDDVEEEADDWEKPETEENWDPDFDEFDLPKSKTKKSSPGTGIPKKKGKTAADDDDLGLDEDFKEMDLFNDSGFDDDDDDF